MTENYKERVLSEFTQLVIDERDNTYFDIAQELKEVYRKAKAMDEILNIDLAQHDEEYADNAMKVVNKFTEGKND